MSTTGYTAHVGTPAAMRTATDTYTGARLSPIMPRIKLTQLQAGQQLDKDALNAHGRLLLKAGTIIAVKHLEILRTWGVVEVDIVGDGQEPAEPDLYFSSLPAATREQIHQQLRRQFKHCNLHHPLIKELLLYQRARVARQLQQGKGTAT